MIKRLTLAALATGLLFGATACGEDMPYSGSELSYSEGYCSMYTDSSDEELDCLRDELPELSDDQLRRIDHLIETTD